MKSKGKIMRSNRRMKKKMITILRCKMTSRGSYMMKSRRRRMMTRTRRAMQTINLIRWTTCSITNSGTKICKTWKTKRMKTMKMRIKRTVRSTSATASFRITIK